LKFYSVKKASPAIRYDGLLQQLSKFGCPHLANQRMSLKAAMDERAVQMKDDIFFFGPFRLSVAERLLERSGRQVKVGGRALDILIALVENAGKVIDKRDLLAQIWPNVTVDDSSLRFHVATLRKTLGDGQEGARYLATLSGRGYCFVASVSRSSISRQETVKIPVREQSGRLPARLTRMIGRTTATQEISEQLKADRFVTIVGPGGIGKTTVAVSLAHMLTAAFGGAAYFFDFGALNDPQLVPGIVASTLGILVRSDDPTPGLIQFLQGKRMLLVFDSCEHVIQTVAALIESIFQEASLVHILATSRESLRVEGEHIHQLSPLQSPPDDPGLSLAQLLSFPAARLFIERVAASGRPLQLDEGDATFIGEICRRLDGIALAIELAAARVATHGIQETAALLNDRFRLLWNGRRTALLRHQTLGATLDWSYDLLSERERAVLRRLAIFVGIFTLDAARSVTTCEDIDENDIVGAVASLVSKSLVTVDSTDPTTRFRLLDTTRAYALEKLTGGGEEARTAERHANYFLEVLTSENGTSVASPDIGYSRVATLYLANIRAALEWCFSERGDHALGTALAVASIGIFLELSLLTECHRWTEEAIRTGGSSILGTRREMELQSAFGLSLMFTRGNTEQVRNALARGLVVAEGLVDLHHQLQLLGRLHIFHERIGDYRSALMFAKQGEAVAAELADPMGIAEAHSALGISFHLEGNNPAAHKHLEAALAEPPVSERINTFHFGFDFRNRAQIALARTLWLEGYPDRAVKVARQSVEGAETSNHPVTLCIALIWAISVYLWVGDLNGAEEHLGRFSAQADRHTLAPYQAVARGVKGELLIKRGNPELGVRLLRRSLKELHERRYELMSTSFNGALAEGLAMTGQIQSSLNVLDRAIATVEHNGDMVYMPELLRQKGSIIAASGASEVEELYKRSLELAGRQGALAWELRTATSLAQFQANQGRHGEARRTLQSVHARLTEGFLTPECKLAESLLEEFNPSVIQQTRVIC